MIDKKWGGKMAAVRHALEMNQTRFGELMANPIGPRTQTTISLYETDRHKPDRRMAFLYSTFKALHQCFQNLAEMHSTEIGTGL